MVFIPRKKRTTSYKYKPSASRGMLQTTVKRRVRYPARLQGSRINYVVNKAVSKAMTGVSETKLIPCKGLDQVAPVPISNTDPCLVAAFTVGGVPQPWVAIPGLIGVQGMTFPNGTGHAQRIGRFIYLKKTHITMQIDMDSNSTNGMPTEFRVICFKARRGNNPMGISNVYANTLFLDSAGDDLGQSTPNTTGTDIMFQPINRKDWDVKSDKRFHLSNALLGNSNQSYSGKYPVMKRLTYNLPYYAKAEIIDDQVANLDTNYVIAIYARGVGGDISTNNWEVSLRGTTTYTDN